MMELSIRIKELYYRMDAADRRAFSLGSWVLFVRLRHPSIRTYKRMLEGLGLSGVKLTPAIRESLVYLFRSWDFAERYYDFSQPLPIKPYIDSREFSHLLYEKRYENSIYVFRLTTGLTPLPDSAFIRGKGMHDDQTRQQSLLHAIKSGLPAKLSSDYDLISQVEDILLSKLRNEAGLTFGIPFNIKRDYRWIKEQPSRLKDFYLTESDMEKLYEIDKKYFKYFNQTSASVETREFSRDWTSIFSMSNPSDTVCLAFVHKFCPSVNVLPTDCEIAVRKFLRSVCEIRDREALLLSGRHRIYSENSIKEACRSYSSLRVCDKLTESINVFSASTGLTLKITPDDIGCLFCELCSKTA